MTVTVEKIQAARQASFAEGAFFETESVELDGQTYRAYKHAPKTAIEVIQNGRGHGDVDFLVYEDERYTFNEFYANVDALAAVLQKDYGVKKGDRVAIAMRNNPQWLFAYAAATLIGALVVPINSWGKTEELDYAIKDRKSVV